MLVPGAYRSTLYDPWLLNEAGWFLLLFAATLITFSKLKFAGYSPRISLSFLAFPAAAINKTPFDHKTTVFPKGFGHTLDYAINHEEELISWLYEHQSSQGRLHYKNRLFVIVCILP